MSSFINLMDNVVDTGETVIAALFLIAVTVVGLAVLVFLFGLFFLL